jgi:Tol biopolymer transport system component
MTDDTLGPRTVRELRAYADRGIRPIDAMAIAETATGGTRRLSRSEPAGGRWPSAVGRRWPTLVLLGLLLLAALAAAFATVGSRLPAPAVLLVSPSPTSLITAVPTGRLAFVTRQGGDDIWVVNADGSGLAQLTSNPGPDSRPAWSPDGTRIAYVVGDAAGQIWVMNADGSNKRQLTHNPFPVGRPTWSPDGSRIAFSEDPAMSVRLGGLYVMNADGSGQVEITTDVADLNPAWSPSGDRIAFVSGDSIYTVQPDGSGRAEYATVPGARSLSWSPDGSQIVAQVGDDNVGIWLVKGGGTPTMAIEAGPLLPTGSQPSLRARSPSWSGDGQWIAFAGETEVTDPNSYFRNVADIYAVRVDGSGVVKVTTNAIKAAEPSWSWAP